MLSVSISATTCQASLRQRGNIGFHFRVRSPGAAFD